MVLARAALAACVLAAASVPAEAQRVPFERTFDVGSAPTLDVMTDRGKIDISVGDPGRVVVQGTVTVREGFNVPADALAIARRVAEHPPVEIDGAAIRLRTPTGDEER